MSGGHWNYQDQKLDEESISWMLAYLPIMIETLRKCFHEVDWAICQDTNREIASKRVYELIDELGERLYG